MVRATSAPASRNRRKKILKRCSGFWGDRKNHIRQSKNAYMSALGFNTLHRKQRKSEFRALWITRIGVAAKLNGISYSKLMFGLKKANIALNRKMLAEMAQANPTHFTAIAETAKKSLAA